MTLIPQTKVNGVDAQKVVILDGSGVQITSFGGGTQYTEGDTDTTLTGTVAIAEGPSNTATPLQVDASKHLQVDIAADSVGIGGGTEYTEGDTDASITGKAILWEDAADTLTTVSTSKPLPVVQTGTPGLPTGAATSAKQDTIIGHVDGIEALLTTIDADTSTLAGAVSGTEMQVDVLTMPTVQVQSNSANLATQTTAAAIQTSVELIDDAVFTDDTSTHSTGATKGIGFMAAATPTDASVNANDIGMVAMTTDRKLHVSVQDALPAGTNAIGKLAANSGVTIGAVEIAAAQTLATVTTVSTVSALGAGTTGPMKAEDVASAAGDQGVAIMAARLDTPVANAGVSNDGDYTTPILDNYRKLWITGSVPEDTAHVAGEGILMNGARRIDTAATSAGTSGDWATLDASAEGALWGTLTPTTTSGCSIFRSLDIDETEEDVKTSAGNIYAIYFGNAVASSRYLKFYNATAANVTVGSTTPVITFLIPASAAGWLALPYPISFSTAISVACTTGVADADTGAPAANDVITNIFYK